MEAEIANLTHHQQITEALLSTMGESMAKQNALQNIPLYDGKNMSLKTFLQDVESGYNICPIGIRDSFFKGVVAKLRDTARDAVSGVEINDLDTLKNTLKVYFAPRKTYSHYCAEIQGIRLRKNESVMEYYSRIKKMMENAKASLKEKFVEAQIPSMVVMLEGIALESFKRGLSDDLLYAMSVQEPLTLENAVKIAQRIERDMIGSSERKGSLLLGTGDDYDSRQVRFREEEDPPRWRSRSPGERDFRPQFKFYDQRGRQGPIPDASPRSSRSPIRQEYPKIQGHDQSTYRNRSPTPTGQQFPNPCNCFPPMGYGYPPPYIPMPPMYPPYSPPFFPQQQPPFQNRFQRPYYPQQQPQIAQRQQLQPNQQTPNQGDLNSSAARHMDASTSAQVNERPASVKFVSAGDMMTQHQDEDQHQ